VADLHSLGRFLVPLARWFRADPAARGTAMEPLESTPQRTFGYAGSHPVDPKGLTRFQRVADLLFWGGAQNPLQRDCPVQTGSG
jgi:transglutaminase-like putative cysteine protease